MLFHNLKYRFGIELIKVINKHRTFTEPLTVELAPEGLEPACIGDCEMKSAVNNSVPEYTGHNVSEGVLEVMSDNLGIAGST